MLQRDLKAENLLLKVEGGKLRVIFADFGLTRDLLDEETTQSRVGTVTTMAPELDEVLRLHGGHLESWSSAVPHADGPTPVPRCDPRCPVFWAVALSSSTVVADLSLPSTSQRRLY